MRINKSSAPARGWMKKALCAGVIMGLSMTAGISYAAKNDSGGDTGMTPFARIAKVPVVRLESGQIDRAATYDLAKTVALDIARYVAHKNDITESGFPANWIVGGLEGGETADDTTINGNILRIPSPNLIDNKNPALGIKKANVMDLCNGYYAKQALGVDPIKDENGAPATGDKVVNGYSHTPALPCQLATWNDDEHIYVDMLDPNAIFTLFFTDVFASAEMQNPVFADAISALPPAVKSEIKTVVYNALDDAGYNYTATDQALGPKYRDIDAAFEVVANSPYVSPFKHVAYTKNDGTAFGPGETKTVTKAIMDAMTYHGTPDAGNQVPALKNMLSANSKWRSARHEPLGLPSIHGPDKNWVIEACSPTYAKMAMGTGMHHATALPCEIAVQRVDRLDENGDPGTDGVTESLVISYLDPNFMLSALFADMSDKEKAALGGIPALILTDLETIVQFALDNHGTVLNPGTTFGYSMLP